MLTNVEPTSREPNGEPETAPVRVQPRSASAGAQMFKRNDVIHLVNRAIRHARNARTLADEDGRVGDADLHSARIRALQSVLLDIQLKAPVFINQVSVEANAPAPIARLQGEAA